MSDVAKRQPRETYGINVRFTLNREQLAQLATTIRPGSRFYGSHGLQDGLEFALHERAMQIFDDLPDPGDDLRQLVAERFGLELVREPEPRQPSHDDLLAVLRRGLSWLYEEEHTDRMGVDHMGVSFSVGYRRYQFAPQKLPVVIVNAGDSALDVHGRPIHPIEADEMQNVTAALAELGHEVHDAWNGHPFDSGSLRLSQEIPQGLQDAVTRKRSW